MILRNRLAFITGGGRGIGAAIAHRFAIEGADVVIAARSFSEVQSVAEQIASEGVSRSLALACDVSNPTAVAETFDRARQHFGSDPDIVVNNAGIALSSPLTKTSNEVWDRIIATNLSGVFYCMRDAIPAMLARGWGRVINISSVAGVTGGAYVSAYSASKHGVVGLTRSVALEVAGKGITVNAICPGYVDTGLTESAVSNIADKTGMTNKDALSAIVNTNPQRRLITVDEVAALALLLASDEGRGINGQAIPIDGGAVLH